MAIKNVLAIRKGLTKMRMTAIAWNSLHHQLPVIFFVKLLYLMRSKMLQLDSHLNVPLLY